MSLRRVYAAMLLFIGLTSLCYSQPKKFRIFVVSSYDPGYLWSQDTNKGECQAFIDFKFLDDQKQTDKYTFDYFVESSSAVIKKAWMDTKVKDSRKDIAEATSRITAQIKEFKPDIILLGDDNAANYIGQQFIDTNVPIVFWGINGIPVKYGLLESMEHPGHNVTGVYQSGYPRECIEYLKKLVPDIKTMAVLADDSETGRTKAKLIARIGAEAAPPVNITKIVVTNSFAEWKEATLKLQDKVDAFFVVNHSTLKDDAGQHVDQLQAGAWYLKNIKKPECSDEKQFVTEGLLLTVDDSGYKQGYEAVRIANKILRQRAKPADMQPYAPDRGLIMVNRLRAKALGIDLSGKDFIEEYVDDSAALKKFPDEKN